MTVSTTTDRKSGPFAGNGIVVDFVFDWKVFDGDDVLVVKNDVLGAEIILVLDVDYELVNNADQDNNPGGTVTTIGAISPLAVGEFLTVLSGVDQLQGTALPSAGPWNPRVVEDALDKAMIAAQDLQEQLDRTIKYPVTEVAPIIEWPEKSVRALKAVGFDAAGDLQVGNSFVSGAVTVSAFSETVLDDGSAAAWLTTLGFSVFTQGLRSTASAGAFMSGLGITAFGQSFIMQATAGDGLTELGFTPFAKTLVDDASASVFLDTLGFSAYGKSLIVLADAAALRAQLGFSAFGDTWVTLADAAAGRAALGLGTMAVQDAATVAITGGTITGITDLAIADGGTGASTAGGARTALGSGATGDAVFVAATFTAARTALQMGVVRVTVDSVHAVAATFADITDLQVPMLSGKKYAVTAHLFHTNDASTTGSFFGYNIGAAPTAARFSNISSVTNSVTAAALAAGHATARDTALTAQSTGQTAVGLTIISGFIQPSADGTFSLRAASEVTVASGLIVLAGSWMEVKEIDN